MAGINRALVENRNLAKANDSANRPCIFLSHISIDNAAAVAIGNYITKQGDLDIYLDLNDPGLLAAVASGDPIGITNFIEKGLSHSTHIMCLVSANTVRSWWVPFELGFGKKSGKDLSTFKLKGQVELPAFLAISEIILGTKSFNEYLTRVRRGLAKGRAVDTLTETLTRYTVTHPLDN